MRNQTSLYSVPHSHSISKVFCVGCFSHHKDEPGVWGEGVYLEGGKFCFRFHQGEKNFVGKGTCNQAATYK